MIFKKVISTIIGIAIALVIVKYVSDKLKQKNEDNEQNKQKKIHALVIFLILATTDAGRVEF